MKPTTTRVFIRVTPDGEEYCALTDSGMFINGLSELEFARTVRTLSPVFSAQDIVYETPSCSSVLVQHGCLITRDLREDEQRHFNTVLDTCRAIEPVTQ